MMRGKHYCITCCRNVEIVNVIQHKDYNEQILSCGHFGKHFSRCLTETLSTSDKVEGEVMKVRTLGQGPVLVSGSTGTYLASGNFQGTINNNGQIINGNLTINNYNLTRTTIESNTNLNNLQQIFNQVETSDYSQEEKDKIKSSLTKVDSELRSLGGILDKALPFAQLLLSIVQKS